MAFYERVNGGVKLCISELTKLLEERNSLIDTLKIHDLSELDMKIVSAILEIINEDKPIIFLDEYDVKDMICGKVGLHFMASSFMLTELNHKIQHILKDEIFNTEVFDAENILLYISCGKDISIQVINKIASEIKSHVKLEVQIKLGCGISDDENIIHVYVIYSRNKRI
ncbi:hypothetical protein [Anaerovorax odorimutans]|uniref:hypothetical protein n=1 Tax=Anaerovorax odorimutans TaxID=109327 RepID=UPI000407962D|nr:hypothetical protein [Anaerovorax odorimutans]